MNAMQPPAFIFATCQFGAEPALKAEIARRWPAFRLAFSRPGFLTFKLPSGVNLPDDLDLHSTFARSYGFSLGKAMGTTADECAQAVFKLIAGRNFERSHVWQRDLHEPGFRGYESGPNELTAEADLAIRRVAPEFSVQESGVRSQESADENHVGVIPTESTSSHACGLAARQTARLDPPNSAHPGELVLDCVIVEPHEWWIGYHRAASIASRWTGGMFPLELPENAVSRAYLKMAEALAWSRLPLRAGEVWAEIGSAPGGASQALLGHGLKVIGVDPADMDPVVLADPNFTHWKKRGADVRRREFRGVKVLTADINVAPNYTLDTVENIVMHPEVNLRGLLLTLKLLEWKLAESLPEYLDRIRSWGFGHVKARQLHHNRQEVCVAAKRK
jgi:23S rRNA (cytidine2498-2'-O)-methyltransferase